MEIEFDRTSRKLEKLSRYLEWRGILESKGFTASAGVYIMENFEKLSKDHVLDESAGVSSDDQFHETMKMIEAGKGAMVPRKDYFLTRYACYLIAMNGDTDKEIANAQSCRQTRRQEIYDAIEGENKRLQLRKG
ncbi:MAG: hypothetical protein R3B95_01350 [Nitrospirales bacterium]|nr:hypothetical protein [Nitrospirales bacterium]